jgi:hypothetical protein
MLLGGNLLARNGFEKSRFVVTGISRVYDADSNGIGSASISRAASSIMARTN